MTHPADEVLVIGYGNELRGDDAVGPRVAAAIEELDLPQVRVRIVQQLTPELAELVSVSKSVVFVDAAIRPVPGEVHVETLRPVPLHETLGHVSNPRMLLALAEAVFGRAAPSWLITVGALNTEVGDRLTPAVAQAIPGAIEAVTKLVQRALAVPSPPDHDHDHPHPHDHPHEDSHDDHDAHPDHPAPSL
ncbi:MAG: hydrogenase maturation protease [Limisphaerales bacterium]